MQAGDYLIVGVYGDVAVNSLKGDKFPILNLQERVLSVLGCKVSGGGGGDGDDDDDDGDSV
jgi:bifunctional ADP-heptose synthase (sugar kinase/adenylyltransferase)